jgi:hypothetical protein
MLLLLLSMLLLHTSHAHSRIWLSAANASFRSGSDLTDRPDVGKSTISFTQTVDGVHATGLLYALQGREGPVGFAYVASDTPVDATQYSAVELWFKGGPKGTKFQVLVKDDQENQPQGILSFKSKLFEATENPDIVKLDFKDFIGDIRGRSYPDFKLRLDKIKTFQVQLTRSTQVLSTVPLPFNFSITGDVILVNGASKM